MRWTQKHSRNAVAARARRRMTPPDFSAEARRKIRLPRARARFQLQIRDLKIGDSLTLSLAPLPWRGRFATINHQLLSTHQLTSALAHLLNSAWAA